MILICIFYFTIGAIVSCSIISDGQQTGSVERSLIGRGKLEVIYKKNELINKMKWNHKMLRRKIILMRQNDISLSASHTLTHSLNFSPIIPPSNSFLPPSLLLPLFHSDYHWIGFERTERAYVADTPLLRKNRGGVTG